VAWEPLGWEPVSFAEIEAFPSAVLAHHWPDVPNIGNMEDLLDGTNRENFDLLVGGTPCQSFSVAGLRRGLDDPRGNLMLTYGAIADAYKPRWFVWENVPGVLSSNKGRDFGAFLGMLAQIGYGFAYRVLDAQYFGVPQRRRRVFVVGCLGDWRSAASVLFESESLQGDIKKERKKRPEVAATLKGGSGRRGWNADDGAPLIADPFAALTANGVGTCGADDNQGQAGHLISIMAHGSADAEINYKVCPTLTCDHEAPIAFHGRQDPISAGVMLPLEAKGGQCIIRDMQVRRLTPVECERLQGFPDNHTRIPWRGKPPEDCPDGPRYKALGNSMAVPVMRWIGERIRKYETANYNPSIKRRLKGGRNERSE
jgi:DNA (cytosine-5)-methyltransferase 1